MKNPRTLSAACAAAALLLLLMVTVDPAPARLPAAPGHSAAQDTAAKTTIYTCPMHPSVRNAGPGRCPICGMDLTPVTGSGSPERGDRARFSVSRARQQAIGVKRGTAALREIRSEVSAVGSVTFDERKLAVVNLRYSGWIDSVHADFNGKRVRRGDPLFRINSPEAATAQREHLVSLEHASDTSWTAEAALPGKGIRSATAARLAFLGFTPGQVESLERSGEASPVVTVLSPMTGTVIEKEAAAGMFVEPGTKLYTIADLSTVWLNAAIYQSEIPAVKAGQDAVVRFDQLPGREFRGIVAFIFPGLEPETRSARARIEIPNHDRVLVPGMFGSVTIRTPGRRALTIPTGAVMNTGTREIVFISGDGDELEARIVRTGARNSEWCEILEGVSEGEQVIASANFLIDAESRIQGVLDRLQPGKDTP